MPARSESEADPEHGTLRLRGSIDAASAPALLAQWAGRAATLRRIDLSAVTRIDSAGVALVQELLERARAAGGQATLTQVPDRYLQVCKAHRIDHGTA
ncbi:MAG TPA: STAS domain-containing protein [Xanthomonadaceae bacterium]|nr:STAS domain-containing protein [Xanthomonadaceae bacterium]